MEWASTSASDLISFGPGSGTAALLPKDVAALKQLAGNSGYHFQLLTSVIEVNELQKRRVSGSCESISEVFAIGRSCFSDWHSSPDTNDIRDASSLVLAPRLLAEGAHVRAWDPVAVEDARPHLPGVQLYEDLLEAVSGADAAVIVTEWDELKAFPRPEVRTAMKNPLIVDGRNLSIQRPCGGPVSRTRGSAGRQRETRTGSSTTSRARRSVGSLGCYRAGALTTQPAPCEGTGGATQPPAWPPAVRDDYAHGISVPSVVGSTSRRPR